MSTSLQGNEGHRLAILRDLRVLGTPSEQVFDDFARLAAIACDTPIAVIAFVDEQRVWYKARTNLVQEEIQRDGSFCSHTILQSAVLTVLDPLADEKFASNFQVMELGVRFFAGIPLTVNNHAVGALAVMDRVPHLLTAEQINCFQILARQIIHELELRRAGEFQSPYQRLHLAPPGRPSATILLVEDNDNLGDLLQRTLGGGYALLSAADGAEALGLCQQHDGAVDLVVSDIAMPRFNGLELSERIRATRPETKVLFITAFGDQFPELHERIKYDAGMLEKPFLPSELLRKVEDTLNQGMPETGTEDRPFLHSQSPEFIDLD